MSEKIPTLRRDLLLCGTAYIEVTDPEGGYRNNGAQLQITSGGAKGKMRVLLLWRGEIIRSEEINIADLFDLLPRVSALLEEKEASK